MRPLLFLIRCAFPRCLVMSSVLLSFGLSSSMAQQGMPMHKMDGHKMDGHKMGGGHDGMQEMMDVNGDGSVSRDEFKSFHSDHFKKADKNNDGNLDAPEFAMLSKIMAEERAKAMELAKQKRMKRHFDKADTDKNGKISKAEFEAIGERHFTRMDHNDDGSLNQDDRSKRMSEMHGTSEKPDNHENHDMQDKDVPDEGDE